MHRFPFPVRFLTLGLLLVAPVLAQAKSTDASEYLNPDKIVITNLVPDVPKPDSQMQADDMAVLLWLQQSRTPEQVATAQQYSDLGIELYIDIIAADLEKDWKPETVKHMFEEVTEAIHPLVIKAKDTYGRTRPYAANLAIQPCVPLEETSSYPSDHATYGILFAHLLADMMPQHKEALLERGKLIGTCRAIGGVHYPSDILAGQRLGTALAEEILAGKKREYWKQLAKKDQGKIAY